MLVLSLVLLPHSCRLVLLCGSLFRNGYGTIHETTRRDMKIGELPTYLLHTAHRLAGQPQL